MFGLGMLVGMMMGRNSGSAKGSGEKYVSEKQLQNRDEQQKIIKYIKQCGDKGAILSQIANELKAEKPHINALVVNLMRMGKLKKIPLQSDEIAHRYVISTE